MREVRTATRLTITGMVQGVGFRPFVHRLANQYQVAGWVRNESGQVEIHAEGEAAALSAFAAAIPISLPPLARIETIVSVPEEANGRCEFRIVESRDGIDQRQPVPPDIVVCDECVLEIFDKGSRRYGYAFTTCTNCGPRYTVIEGLPYDRERTSLREFPLCAQCQSEYETPSDRRFHAESIACHACGPHLTVERATDGEFRSHAAESTTDTDAISVCAQLLLAGGIVAVRALGGFQLAVDATNEVAVTRLRARKLRAAKPFACMFQSIDQVNEYAMPSVHELSWLQSRERPIVLVTARSGQNPGLAPSVSPGLNSVGTMLPSTPLHHLLLQAVGRPLVMTSGNVSDVPLTASNGEARAQLRNVADCLLTHDREIVARIDDSVIRLSGRTPIFLRRARGYAPLPLTLPVATPVPLLAVGAHLKNTFTLVHGNTAYTSPHIGDLDSLEAVTHWKAVRARYESLFHITPTVFVADAHDGYMSTRLAEDSARMTGASVIRVQHHHAHIAAVAAEHGITEKVLGIALDGSGAGSDGTVWGMEFLVADFVDYTRVAHLAPAPLPGGDAAVRAPWRALAGFVSLNANAFDSFSTNVAHTSDTEWRVVQQQIAKSINSPLASSAGRLFDAVASLLGVRHNSSYEGQAAMKLESLADNLRGLILPFPVSASSSGLPVLDPVPLLVALFERKSHGIPVAQLAADFHHTLACAVASLAWELAEANDLEYVALGGGCFQNARLLSEVSAGLADTGLRVLVAQSLPANDGGISFGQAAVAAARLFHTSTTEAFHVPQITH